MGEVPRAEHGIRRVVVVGAGLAGWRTAQQLRRQGFTGQLTLIGDEHGPPYDRPPLSKQVLTGEWDAGQTLLARPEEVAALDLEIVVGKRVNRLAMPEVGCSDGSMHLADAVVIATGSTNRRLTGQPPSVSSLRTLDDALSLRDRLRSAGSALLVGGGFVAAEVASSAVSLGAKVTVVEAESVPMSRGLGSQVGELVARIMREAGVRLVTGATVSGFQGDDAFPQQVCQSIALTDGTVLAADVVVVAVGSKPEVAWLAQTGVDVTDGILCDRSGRVVGLSNVWALGDCARWENARGSAIRHEHWMVAGSQAGIVAASMLGAPARQLAVPYVWSDQFGYKIQVLGETGLAHRIVALDGDGLSGGAVRGTVVGYLDDRDELVAVAGFSAASKVMGYQRQLAGALAGG